MSELQTELDDTRLKIAQMEIAQESLRKKYDNVASERNDLLSRISTLEAELSEAKRSKRQSSEEVKQKIARIQLENDALRKKYESLLKDKAEYKERIAKLLLDVAEKKKTITNLESSLNRSTENCAGRGSESVEKELNRYKNLVEQLSMMTTEGKDKRTAELFLVERVKQLEMDLQGKEERLHKLKDFEKIKEERDLLVKKLKTQAKQFEQYVKSQKQMSVELNLSPRSSMDDGADVRRMREITIKEVREEMEQKVAEELRIIEEQHREKQKGIEERYKSALLELQARCNEKTKEIESMREAMLAEKVKLHSSFKAQEKLATKMIEAKLESFNQELIARKLKIEDLQEQLRRKENDAEEERDLMAQVMSEWAEEIREIKANEEKMNEEIKRLKEVESCLINKIKSLKENEEEMKSSIGALKQRYQSARIRARNYKVCKTFAIRSPSQPSLGLIKFI